MRRLIIVFLAFGLLFALPASAVAQEGIEVTVSSAEAQTGVAPNGASIAVGTYSVSMDGVVFETGDIRSRYLGEDKVRGQRMYRDDATGNMLVTSVKGLLIDVDEANAVFIYKVVENVESSTAGASGRGVGLAVVYGQPDGSFVLEASIDFTLTF